MTRKSDRRAPAEQRPQRVVQEDEHRAAGARCESSRPSSRPHSGARVATRPRRRIGWTRRDRRRARDRRGLPRTASAMESATAAAPTSQPSLAYAIGGVDRRAARGRFRRGRRLASESPAVDDPLRRRVDCADVRPHVVDARRRALRRQDHHRADSAGFTAGRSRYVRAQASVVLTSPSTTSRSGCRADRRRPAPSCTITAPGLERARGTATPRSSEQVRRSLRVVPVSRGAATRSRRRCRRPTSRSRGSRDA